MTDGVESFQLHHVAHLCQEGLCLWKEPFGALPIVSRLMNDLFIYLFIYLLTSTNSEKNRQLQDGYENMIIKIQTLKTKQNKNKHSNGQMGIALKLKENNINK